jgi:DNA-directed RNA polymerase specialized sigma24 family protein
MSNKNKAIEILSKHHSEFISAAKSLAGNNFDVANYAEDYVQEAYIKLLRYDDLYDKIINGDKASKGYMFFTLRSVIFNDLKRVRTPKYNYVGDQYDIDHVYEIIDEGRDEVDVTLEHIEAKMYDVLRDSVEWFDYELFRKYLKTRKSFRVLAEESGLGIQTIYLSIKRSKLVIAEKLYDDYVDFLKLS